MKAKYIQIPHRLLVKAGVQNSEKGGTGKSSTIVTMAEVCRFLGLPVIVASHAQRKTTLERSLGKGIRK